MDEEGLVRSTLEPSTSGPARRNYELTDKGRDALAVFAASMGEVAVALGGIQPALRTTHRGTRDDALRLALAGKGGGGKTAISLIARLGARSGPRSSPSTPMPARTCPSPSPSVCDGSIAMGFLHLPVAIRCCRRCFEP
jgi:hypothetical protein